jgi:hypothetical protein
MAWRYPFSSCVCDLLFSTLPPSLPLLRWLARQKGGAGTLPGDATTSSSTGTRRTLKGDKKDKADKKDKGGDGGKNPYGIGAPAVRGPIFKKIKDQFCTALTECPPGAIMDDAFLTSNLNCAGFPLTLDGAILNGNGFTVTLTSTIILKNGAKLENVDVDIQTNDPITAVTFREGGGAVENVSIMGLFFACFIIQEDNVNFKTVKIEQVTCSGFALAGVIVNVNGPESLLDELVINHATFTGNNAGDAIVIRNALPTTRISVDSVWTNGNFQNGLFVANGAFRS